MAKKKSQIYVELLELIFKLSGQSVVNNVYTNQITDGTFTRTSTGIGSHRIAQPIVIADASLFDKCTSSEWYVVGQISRDLKEYNALWYCDPETTKSNGTKRLAIRGLIQKEILLKTETTNIYLVNPIYIRRGDLFTVISTTANALVDVEKVDVSHIKNKKPVKRFDFNTPDITNQIGYSN